MMLKREQFIRLWKKKTKKSHVEINLISDSDDEQGTNDDHGEVNGEKIPEISHHEESDKSFDENEESCQGVTTVLMEEDSSPS